MTFTHNCEADELESLAEALYFEARGEVNLSQVAVGLVIRERVKSRRFPNTYEEVVHQQRKGICQFSYYCDGKSDKMLNTTARYKSLQLAIKILDGEYNSLDIGSSDHYYNPDKVTKEPYWVKHMIYVGTFGNHKFYRSK